MTVPNQPMPKNARRIVKGHWRKQWFPKLGVHKNVWVDQHVKGDPSTPIIVRDAPPRPSQGPCVAVAWFYQVTNVLHYSIRGDEIAHYGERAAHPNQDVDTSDYWVALCADEGGWMKGVPAPQRDGKLYGNKCPYCSRRLRGHLKRKNKAVVKDLLAMKEEIE